MKFIPFDYNKRQDEIIESIIIFVYEHLCKWRDDPVRRKEKNERILNSDLPKFLTTNAHKAELGLNFYPEEPQENQRTIDISVCYNDISCYNKVIAVFECKRLSAEINGNRKDEYVTGHKETSGGIQRFKLEAHGKEFNTVSMIGYIQSGTYNEWFNKINGIIEKLCDKPDENKLTWTKNELLNLVENDNKNGKHHSKSVHLRNNKTEIKIHHLWVDMQL